MRSLAVLVLLAGCAVSNTGVVPIGTGGYMLSRMERGTFSGGEIKATLMREAAVFCGQHGKNFTPTRSESQDKVAFQQHASAEVHFRCE
jgi:hypothetical protein